MRAALVALVMVSGRVAMADLMDPISVQSVRATNNTSKTLWKVVAGEDEAWCLDKITPSSKLTITLVGEPIISDITLKVDGGITGAEVLADGTSHSGSVADGELGFPLKTRPIGEFVISVTGTGHGCVKHIELTEGPAIYSTNNGSTLWADVKAARSSLVACDKQQLAKTFAFPFTVTWPDMDESGMKWPHTKYRSADKLAAGCTNVHIAKAAIKLDGRTQPKVSSASATTLSVDDGEIRWELVLQNKHWRVKAFAFPGA